MDYIIDLNPIKFVLVREYGGNNNILTVEELCKKIPKYREYVIPRTVLPGDVLHTENYNIIRVAALVAVTKDFDPVSPELTIVHQTDSYQIRPKVLHRNTKGYFFKHNTEGTVYLNEEWEQRLQQFVKDHSQRVEMSTWDK